MYICTCNHVFRIPVSTNFRCQCVEVSKEQCFEIPIFFDTCIPALVQVSQVSELYHVPPSQEMQVSIPRFFCTGTKVPCNVCLNVRYSSYVIQDTWISQYNKIPISMGHLLYGLRRRKRAHFQDLCPRSWWIFWTLLALRERCSSPLASSSIPREFNPFFSAESSSETQKVYLARLLPTLVTLTLRHQFYPRIIALKDTYIVYIYFRSFIFSV